MSGRKSRMLFLLQLPPPVHGSSVMGKMLMESEVLPQSLDCRFVNMMTSRGMSEIGKNPLAKAGRYLAILWRVMIELLTWRPDLCYIAPTAKGLGFYKDFPLLLLARLLCSKRVLHFHNKGVADRQNRLPDHLLYRVAFGGAHAILLSGLLRPDVSKYIPESRIHICPNGIPDGEGRAEWRIERREKESVRILSLSNLMTAKGVFVLLDACAILQERGLEFECVFVGSESDVTRSRFDKEVMARNLGMCVRYLGPKYGKEKEAELQRADIFVFPTQWETFGLVVLEAMCHGMPVVVSDEGGLPEIVEDGTSGFVVRKDDATAFADKLVLLINDPIRRLRMGREGRSRFEQRFNRDHFEKRMGAIICEVMEL